MRRPGNLKLKYFFEKMTLWDMRKLFSCYIFLRWRSKDSVVVTQGGHLLHFIFQHKRKLTLHTFFISINIRSVIPIPMFNLFKCQRGNCKAQTSWHCLDAKIWAVLPTHSDTALSTRIPWILVCYSCIYEPGITSPLKSCTGAVVSTSTVLVWELSCSLSKVV